MSETPADGEVGRSPGRRVAVVTGGGSGIGRATALLLFNGGWDVLVADINETSLQATLTAALATTTGPNRIVAAHADVRVEAEVEQMIAAAVDAFGHIDLLVNNAGVGGAFGPVTEIDVEDWDYTFDVLVRSVFLGIKHGARVMGPGGAIVNVASMAAHGSGYAGTAYTSAKSAVRSLTQAVSIELAPRGIRVNSVSPGVIRTPLLEAGNADALNEIQPPQPVSRWGRPEDVAEAIAFLAGDGAAFITGADLLVDGGLVALGPGPEFQRQLHMNMVERGLVGVNRGSTGEASEVRKRIRPPD
jgi:NAD(P)-dependent dehydrogenase (short-subunit alcohol dehydrogenase family)